MCHFKYEIRSTLFAKMLSYHSGPLGRFPSALHVTVVVTVHWIFLVEFNPLLLILYVRLTFGEFTGNGPKRATVLTTVYLEMISKYMQFTAFRKDF